MMLQKVWRWLTAKGQLTLDFEGFPHGLPVEPLEGETESVLSAESELSPVVSAATEQTMPMGVGMEADLYVENTAPCIGDDPVHLEANAEGNAPKSASCYADETMEFLPDALAHAPYATPCDAEERLIFVPEAMTAGVSTAPAECEDWAAVLDAENTLFPAAAEPLAVTPVLSPELDAVVFSALSAPGLAEIGLALCGDAELWIRRSDWVAPVLENRVLAITQAVKTEQNGNILKIY